MHLRDSHTWGIIWCAYSFMFSFVHLWWCADIKPCKVMSREPFTTCTDIQPSHTAMFRLTFCMNLSYKHMEHWLEVWIATGIAGFLGILVNVTLRQLKHFEVKKLSDSRTLKMVSNELEKSQKWLDWGHMPLPGFCFCCLCFELYLGSLMLSPWSRQVSARHLHCHGFRNSCWHSTVSTSCTRTSVVRSLEVYNGLWNSCLETSWARSVFRNRRDAWHFDQTCWECLSSVSFQTRAPRCSTNGRLMARHVSSSSGRRQWSPANHQQIHYFPWTSLFCCRLPAKSLKCTPWVVFSHGWNKAQLTNKNTGIGLIFGIHNIICHTPQTDILRSFMFYNVTLQRVSGWIIRCQTCGEKQLQDPRNKEKTFAATANAFTHPPTRSHKQLASKALLHYVQAPTRSPIHSRAHDQFIFIWIHLLIHLSQSFSQSVSLLRLTHRLSSEVTFTSTTSQVTSSTQAFNIKTLWHLAPKESKEVHEMPHSQPQSGRKPTETHSMKCCVFQMVCLLPGRGNRRVEKRLGWVTWGSFFWTAGYLSFPLASLHHLEQFSFWLAVL